MLYSGSIIITFPGITFISKIQFLAKIKNDSYSIKSCNKIILPASNLPFDPLSSIKAILK